MQWLALWWTPIFVIDFIFGIDQLAAIGYFFSQLAVVTFGSAYAVLAYMAQDVIGHLSWLQPNAMMDGLGLAESTPGPLILVTEFVGFLAPFHAGGWPMASPARWWRCGPRFIPCFLWIFVGAPYIDGSQINHDCAVHWRPLWRLLSASLPIYFWFVLHILFTDLTIQHYGPVSLFVPDVATANPTVILIAVICGALVFWRQAGLFKVLVTSSALGMILGG